MSLLGTLLVGLEEDTDGSLRAYLGRRSTGIHTHVDDGAAKATLRRAWAQGGHTFINPAPPAEALCDCPEPRAGTQ